MHKKSFKGRPVVFTESCISSFISNDKGKFTLQKSTILIDTPQFIAASEINQKDPSWFKSYNNADYTQIIFIEKGRIDFKFADHLFVGKQGDLIILDFKSNIEAKFSINEPPEGISMCFSNLHINGKQKGYLMDSMDLPVIHLQEEKNEIHNYFHAILREIELQYSGYQDVISSILQTVIIKITRHLKKANDLSVSPVYIIVKKYIEENFRQELTLNELANLVYISPYHLSHVFKEEVGMPPIQYMIHCRIEEAKRLLKYSDLSVREIAEVIGYDNPNYFNLLFKKMTGNPPGKYRKMKMKSYNLAKI